MISILIPAYNAGPYLPAALDSIIAQEVADIEIIVLDDGSTDDTATIGENYAQRYSLIRYFRQANGGAAAARNAAFSRSRGRWIVYFDADDLLNPGSLGAAYSLAQAHPRDAIYWSWHKLIGPQRSLDPVSRAMTSDMPGWLWVERAFRHDYPTYPGCFMLPRILIEEYGGWDARLSFQDDMEFYSRILSRTEMVRYCREATFRYRQGVPGSLSSTGGRRSGESQWLATRTAAQHLLSVRDTPEARAAAARQLMLVSYAQYMAAPDISRQAEDMARAMVAKWRWRPWLPGGPIRRVLQMFLGWKLALSVHSLLKRALS